MVKDSIGVVGTATPRPSLRHGLGTEATPTDWHGPHEAHMKSKLAEREAGFLSKISAKKDSVGCGTPTNAEPLLQGQRHALRHAPRSGAWPLGPQQTLVLAVSDTCIFGIFLGSG